MKKVLLLILIVALAVSRSLSTDSDPRSKLAEMVFTDGFICDGQQYNLRITENRPARLIVLFRPNLTYRIVSNRNDNSKLELKLYQPCNKLIYADTSVNKQQSWDLRFKAPMLCTIELTSETIVPSPGLFIEVAIGFKE